MNGDKLADTASTIYAAEKVAAAIERNTEAITRNTNAVEEVGSMLLSIALVLGLIWFSVCIVGCPLPRIRAASYADSQGNGLNIEKGVQTTI